MKQDTPHVGRLSAILAAVLTLAVGLSVSTIAGGGQSVQSGQIFAEPLPPAPRDAPANLAMKIHAPFTCRRRRRRDDQAAGAVASRSAQFQDPIKILKRRRRRPSATWKATSPTSSTSTVPLRGMMGDKDVAPALKAMGFDMMNRANNHIFDSDRESMFSTMEQLDKVGIVHAGHGKEPRRCAPAEVSSIPPRVASAWSACTRRTAW